jgi:hypothetical protein
MADGREVFLEYFDPDKEFVENPDLVKKMTI